MSKGKRANQLWNRLAVPRRVCETKGKLKHCLRVASFSPHSSISRLATMSLYESYSQSRIRHTSPQWYVFLWTTLASCVPVPTGAKPQSNHWVKYMSGYLYSVWGTKTRADVVVFFFFKWFCLDEFIRHSDKLSCRSGLTMWILIWKNEE